MPQSWNMGQMLYFPSEGRHAEDFYTRKIQRLRPGLNPQTWVPEASMLTTRPPKPSGGCLLTWRQKHICNVLSFEHWDTGQSLSRQAVYVLRNFEALSHNHCCSGKAVSIKYFECVSILLHLFCAILLCCLLPVRLYKFLRIILYTWK